MRFSFPFKFTLFLLFGAFCLMWGIYASIGSPVESLKLIRFGGYWMILACFIAWVIGCYQAYPGMIKKDGWRWLTLRKHRWGIALVLFFFVLVQFQFSKDFKILLDEPVLMNTSRMMHFEREVMVVSNAHRVDGILAAKGYVDKRPMFFPFLLATVHDLTGYRIENAFYLNAALLLVLLGLTYAVGNLLGGPGVGNFAVVLLGSLPLVGYQSAGGGFEILNMVMILLTIKIGIDYLQAPNEKRLGALALTVVMLANVRYESALFIVPVAILILMGYSIKGRGMLHWGAWLAPLMLLPLLFQMNVFKLNPDFWELFTVGVAKPFSLDYLYGNIADSLYVFFSWVRHLPNSPWVAYVGWVSAVAFLVVMYLRLVNKERREQIIDAERPTLAFFVFGFGFALYWLLLMCYAFDISRHMVVRLALPIYLFISLAGGLVCFSWIKNRIWHKGLLAFSALLFFSWSVPVSSSATFASLYFPAQDAKVVDAFIKDKQLQGERFLAVVDMSMLWTAYNIEAIPNRAVNSQLPKIKYYLEQPNNVPIYVVQSMEYVPHLHRYVDLASDQLDDRLVLEPFFQRHISTFRILRISRLMDIEHVEPFDDSEFYQDDDAIIDWMRNMP